MSRFLAILSFARLHGYEELARQVAPSAMAIQNLSVEFSFAVSLRSQTSTQIGIRFINDAYQRRFSQTEIVEHKATVAVRRYALAPGPSDEDSAPPTGSPQIQSFR